MDTEPRRDSAVIHPFPPGGRAALRKPQKRPDTVASIPSGRGWYHDLAISESKDAEKPEPRF